MIEVSRRGFLVRAAAFIIAAPAIVHAGNLMPIRSVPLFDSFDAERLIRFRLEITREYVRQNLFAPYTPLPAGWKGIFAELPKN